MYVLAHGREGSPEGTKARALRAAGLDLVVPDCRGLALQERIRLLDSHTSAGGIALIGSSYGGLASAWLIATYPERYRAALLLAPAFQLYEPPLTGPLVAPPDLPVTILHGTRDEIVPIQVSRDYVARSGSNVTLIEVDDDHRLSGSLDRILALAQAMT